MNKLTKILLAMIIAIVILYGLIKWVILPIVIQKSVLDTVDRVDFSSTSIITFNAIFTSYEGTQKGNITKILVQHVLEMNNAEDEHKVSIEFKGSTYSNSNVLNVYNLIDSTETYNVTIKYDDDGYVKIIAID
jgi:hypothetical protein